MTNSKPPQILDSIVGYTHTQLGPNNLPFCTGRYYFLLSSQTILSQVQVT